ncbi:hypothetical protein Ndes2437B_g06615 [Nannochloris sp. 'desiccata']|nr:hypothetical protein KSW81_003899 [Chlorella desiccata (nom. nud.)]
MSRQVLRTLIRAVGPGRVGLHSGEITLMPSLLDSIFTQFYVGDPINKPFKNSYLRAASQFSSNRRSMRTTARTTFPAPNGGGGGGVQTAAEQYDLLPPDTGIVRIEGYDASGFIVSDVQVEGSILCFGDIWLSWSARSLNDISLDSLKLLDLVKPVPELVVIGCGTTIGKLPETFVQQLKERDINVEVLDTVNAVATFNILNQEGRAVVGALLPAGVEPI